MVLRPGRSCIDAERRYGPSHPRRAVATPRVCHAHARTHFTRGILTCCSATMRLRPHEIRPDFSPSVYPPALDGQTLIGDSPEIQYSSSAKNLRYQQRPEMSRNTRENYAPEALRLRRRDGSRLFVVCSMSCLSARSTMAAPSAGKMKDFARGRDIRSLGHRSSGP